MKSAAIVLACASFAYASFSTAAQQVYEFSGVLTNSATNAPVDLGVGPGTTFTGFIIYDPDQFSNCHQINGSVTHVCAAGSGLEWGVSFGSFSLDTKTPAVLFGTGGLSVQGGLNTFTPSTYQGLRPGVGSDQFLSFSNPLGPIDLSSPPADLSVFQNVSFTDNAFLDKIPHQGDAYYWNISGTATEFKSVGVPEPGVLPLCLTGLVALAWTSRRRREVRA